MTTWRRFPVQRDLKLLEIVLCLVHILQANDLVYLMAYPKVGFLLSLQRVFNFCSPPPPPRPQRLVEDRTLT